MSILEELEAMRRERDMWKELDSIYAEAVEELTEAIRFTVEYVGTNVLRPIEGWSWYDALRKYAPEKADLLLGDIH